MKCLSVTARTKTLTLMLNAEEKSILLLKATLLAVTANDYRQSNYKHAFGEDWRVSRVKMPMVVK